MDNALGYQTMW
jgi:hypothetical protein